MSTPTATPTMAPSAPSHMLRMLDFPTRFFIAPAESSEAAVYNLEEAPASAFETWFAALIDSEQSHDAALTVAIVGIDRQQWTIQERWVALHDLEARGISLPLYTSREAAISAMEAVHLAGLSTATAETAAA